jgi:hypothetical protein
MNYIQPYVPIQSTSILSSDPRGARTPCNCDSELEAVGWLDEPRSGVHVHSPSLLSPAIRPLYYAGDESETAVLARVNVELVWTGVQCHASSGQLTARATSSQFSGDVTLVEPPEAALES